MKNKGGVSFSFGIGEFISMMIVICLIVLLFRFLSGDIIKFDVQKELYKQSGKAINLLNVIITSSDIVEKDSLGQPQKGLIKKEKLLEINNNNKELECCNYIDYDYYIEVKNLETSEFFTTGFPKKTMNNFFNLGKKCKLIDSDEFLFGYKVPISISEGDNIQLGEMVIYLIKTPLSNIADIISQACLKTDYSEATSFYGLMEETDNIIINEKSDDTYEVCVKSQDDINMCKIIKCNLKIKKLNEDSPKCGSIDGDCPKGCSHLVDKDCKIEKCYSLRVENKNNIVSVYVPKGF